MKKAMIITVGTGTGVENGIAFSIRQHNPELLCFIYSNESERTLEAVLSKLEMQKEEVILKQFDETNDIEKLYQEYSKYVDEIINKGYKASEIVADYTSGTKSMSSALVNVAISKEIGILSYVYGLRDAQGRVISNTERLSTLSPNAIFTEQKITQFKHLFNHYQFDVAYELLKNSIIHPNFKELADFYMQLSQAYANWDRFNFKKASEYMNSIDIKIAAQLQIKRIIEIHKTQLHKLKQANEQSKLSEDDIRDLFSNALRRYEEGKYDDCVARLYRLVEMIGQVEFEKEFGTPNDKVPIDFLPERLKELYINKASNQQVPLGLTETFEVLKEKSSNKRAKIFHEKIDEFKKLLSVRNHSRLAHGQNPISKETSEKLIGFIREVFEIKEEIKFPKLK